VSRFAKAGGVLLCALMLIFCGCEEQTNEQMANDGQLNIVERYVLVEVFTMDGVLVKTIEAKVWDDYKNYGGVNPSSDWVRYLKFDGTRGLIHNKTGIITAEIKTR